MAAIASAIAAGVVGWPLSFEVAEDLKALKPSGLKAFERVRRNAADGEWALRVVFPGSDKDTWPGFWVTPPAPDLSGRKALIFHVYNPADKACRLSWRVDDKDGRHVFGAHAIPPRKPVRVAIWFSSMRYALNIQAISRIYLYYSKPRRDWELYFDNLRFAQVSEVFRPVVHVPERRPEGLPAAEGPAAILFARPWMDHVFADDWPEEGVEELFVAAAQGEYEPVTLSVAARRKLRGVRAKVASLQGPGGVSQADIEVRIVRALDKRWTYHDPAMRYIVGVPVLLEPLPDEGVDIEPGKVVRFWMTVRVPDRARPGEYRGEVVVSAAGGGQGGEEIGRVRMRLRVYPFRLPEVRDKFWGVYYTGPREIEAGDELEKLARHLRDMREHGMTSVGLCFGWQLAQTDVEGRRVDFLPPGRGRYETFMELYRKLEFPAPVIQLSDTAQAAAAAQIPLDSELFAKVYSELWKFVTRYGKEHGWPEIIVQPVDEPAWRGEDAKERNRKLLEILKRLAPEIRTEQDGPGDEYFHKVAGPLADVWNYNGGLGEPEVVRQAKGAGKIILIYNCDVEWYRPVVDRYVAGWFQVVSGADGCFNWAYQSFGGDPYDDQDAKYGDHIAYYPPMEGRPGGPSVAWEGFREGIDDYRYVALLRDLIAKARKDGSKERKSLAREAEEKLERIIASIDYSARVRGRARFARYWEEDGKLFVSGRLELPNGWTMEDYARARRAVADLCARLAR